MIEYVLYDWQLDTLMFEYSLAECVLRKQVERENKEIFSLRADLFLSVIRVQIRQILLRILIAAISLLCMGFPHLEVIHWSQNCYLVNFFHNPSEMGRLF